MTVADVSVTVPSTERIPTEFRHYWTAVSRPRVRLARAAARRVLGFDLFPDEARVLDFAHGYYDADPLADAFVAEVYVGRGAIAGRRMLDLAITEGVDAVPEAPRSLVQLFAHAGREPEWLDRDRAARGAAVFRRFGLAAIGVSGAGEFNGFTENPAVKPLSLHGGFVGRHALYRLMETARFWIDTTDPGGLDEGGAGRAAALRVRVLHAVIRRRLMTHPEWDHDAWGVPISQSEMIAPLLGTTLVAFPLKLTGHRSTRDEIDALLHFWRYVGHIMGLDPRWYPETVREALQCMAMYMAKRSWTGGADSVELIEAYGRAFVPLPGTSLRKRVRDEVNYRAQLGYTHFALRSLYGEHDMPNPWPWALHPFAQWPVNFAATTLARHSTGAARALDRYQRWRRETWWRNEMGDRPAAYAARAVLRTRATAR